ncbi:MULTISPECIES: four helix bundle protein [Olivibacter]|uniref:Four helix bundle protein n=2 Tax=Olivibacter TaxID=376469 RepID=A0ABV6HNK9_9SPHI|nr:MULTISPECIES: four helix bundle protein [Olivibacter]MCL4640517.1 four helix bundle protein [Olivibacter sp. UJ_SKK_5.1]MDM8173492.1 four helix bundle protein [Olivibacter sp. 47]MDX3914583.1 four helix bundle protein [Pseudosphingobacterium sp.]QEL03214.1 four helix bundle protein [Olivibacter sp. LS-1]
MTSTFEDLEVWKHCRSFRNKLGEVIKLLPNEEKYRLSDQLKRAARSVTANIAEGYGRFHYQENIQFCRQSRGSLYEILDHLICALDEQYIDNATFDKCKADLEKCIALLNGYILYLKKRKE